MAGAAVAADLDKSQKGVLVAVDPQSTSLWVWPEMSPLRQRPARERDQ